MRIVSLRSNGAESLGVMHDASVVDMAIAAPKLPSDLLQVLYDGPSGLAALKAAAEAAPASAHKALDSVTLAPPLARPGKIICLGLNYTDHATEGGHALPGYPSFFLRSSSSLVGHGGFIIRPLCSEQLDYEAELAVVIGRSARHVATNDALKHVAGYSSFNDASIRDYQRKTTQWTVGKNFDSTGAFGPAFVSVDEIPNGGAGLRIVTRLNGQIMQDSNTSRMLFPVADTISLLSECMTLEPGDVLVMGTPSGVGHARRPQVWMKNGDIVEVEIERVGLLRNTVKDEVVN